MAVDKIPPGLRTELEALDAGVKAMERGDLIHVVQRSAESPEQLPAGGGPVSMQGWMAGMIGLATSADGVPDWGTAIGVRDARLRQFLSKETMTTAAFGTVIARNAAMSWEIKGRPRNRDHFHEVLSNADWGDGWQTFATKLAMDYLSQDKGAWFQPVREEDRPDAPCIGLKTLDAAYCWPTGDPEFPAFYLDRVTGKIVKLAYWSVCQLVEQPAHHPMAWRLQLSAMTRVLRLAQLWKTITTYYDEKIGGKNTKAIHVITGITPDELQATLLNIRNQSIARGMTTYMEPALFANPNPTANASVATLDLASIPDGFDLDSFFEMWLILLSMGLNVDMQELAPLRGGNIGSATQSETLDKKSKRRGASIWRKALAYRINQYVLPKDVEFEFDENDIEEEQGKATASKTRAETRGLMVQTGELDPAGARQMAVDSGDMSEELFLTMNERDLTESAIRDDERAKVANELKGIGVAMPKAPVALGPNVVGVSGVGAGIGQQADQPGAPVDDESKELDQRAEAEEALTAKLSKALRSIEIDVVDRLKALDGGA